MKRDAIADEIVNAAAALAAERGFEGVHQREVAARAGVALRTLYKRFGSKELLLAATLEKTTQRLERRLARRPVRGKTPAARLRALFAVLNGELLAQPNFARAIVRAMASGVPGLAAPVVAYQERCSAMVFAALRPGAPPSERDQAVVFLLLQVWFATQVGWSAGLADEKQMNQQMAVAIDLLAL